MNKALDLLRGLVSEVERKTCCHEETHRGGAIWEICDSCGAKWADDEGGKPEFAWPESVEKARAFLATHPAVEQAGGDERAAFDAYRDRRNAVLESEGHKPGSKWHVTNAHYPTWEASRAALAQPSPKCATCGGTGMVDDGEITCSEGGIPYENGPVKCVKDCPDCKAQPSPALAEQAEAERPEVVAWLVVAKYPHKEARRAIFMYEANAYDQGAEWCCDDGVVTISPLIDRAFVAQAERIAGALRAELQSQRERNTELIFKLGSATNGWGRCEKERDAALARVAEFEAQAQHSVPEGYALIPVRETEAMHDAVMALLYKGVARTDTQKLLDAYIAAAPGKEVGHE
ncbi:TPA: hypothetical protein ACJX8O_003456 [Pseudomonas aeruginosa]